MSILNEIGILFSTISIGAAICLIVGLVFIIVEIFQPGFGVFGTLGIILCILSVYLHVSQGHGSPLAQAFLMIFIICACIVTAFLIMLSSAKKGWISRSPLIKKGAVLNEGIAESTKDYTNLMGAIGVATTDLRPVGRAQIGGELYDVVADGFYIAKGEGVRVTGIEGVKILVRRAE
ncbi:MAG: NfeD family protein [Christensenellales bacterium]|jgi:membrane-bound serine protease (ClpP class)